MLFSLSSSYCLEIADFFNVFLMSRKVACRILGFQNLFFALVEFCRLSCWVGSRDMKWMAYSIYGLCYTLLFRFLFHTHLWLCYGGLIKPLNSNFLDQQDPYFKGHSFFFFSLHMLHLNYNLYYASLFIVLNNFWKVMFVALLLSVHTHHFYILVKKR